MLEQLIKEVKRARDFGFHQQEMDDAMKVFLASVNGQLQQTQQDEARALLEN